ncbi:uncharacterized protein ALTATR162_LOCUS9816 [Alternaria atra]|uniref:GAF domain-containing protein n=1 Tax=Alternaria atra TaxID=119953 RepID=A0A8J2IIS2_9PLEO|nr:uncharacterized protein ALTATR162_LOCUS9816 [Alternaria atra]CAG5181751.1 unnamed protein product [Alternaria atra]
MSRPSIAREERQREREQMKRNRDVLLLYGSAFANIPYIEHVPKHCPRPSPDTVLTALCQLAAIRLNAERCMVSLLDEESGRQHWLSEATRDLALRPEMPGDAPETLWLGNVSTPRSWGLCKELLSLSPEDEPVFSIDDLTKDGRSTFRDHIKGIPEMHFFASTALKSPNGCIVGSMCVFDGKSRDGLTKEEVVLLRGLAATVMDHLHTYTVQDCYRRGERFTRGLISFAEGAAVISPLDTGSNIDPTQKDATNVVHLQSTSAHSPPRPDASKPAMPSVDTSIAASPEGTAKPTSPPTSPVSKTRSESVRNQAIEKLQNEILPMNAKSMFSRAASIMMASSDLDGVLILDASVAANYQRHGPRGFANDTDTPYESDISKMSSSDSASGTDGIASNCASSRSSSKKCQVLGMATYDRIGEVQLADILEADLGRLLQEFPNGKIITFTTNGLSLSSNDDSSDLPGADGVKPSQSGEPPKRTASQKSLKGSKAVQAMFPGARCVAFVPFWDYERKKKLQIMSMFCVGFIITIVSCLRLQAFVQFAKTQNPTYDNTSGLYWCATESNLFTIVACMPAMRSILHKTSRRFRDISSYASKGHYDRDGLGKGSYLRHDSEQQQRSRSGSLPFGVISKSTDVNIYYTERSDSDVELVDRPPGT